VKLGRDGSNTCIVPSKMFGGEAMKKSNVFKLYKLLIGGHKNMEDDERSGHPRPHRTDENVDEVRNLVHSTVSQAYYVEMLKQLT
jgi:hypothetical protein